MQSSNSKVEDKSCLSISKSSIKSGKSVDLSLAPSFGKQSSVFSPISIKSKSNSKIAEQQQEIHKILNEQSEIHESRAPSAKNCK